jgi:hypothetical protein
MGRGDAIDCQVYGCVPPLAARETETELPKSDNAPVGAGERQSAVTAARGDLDGSLIRRADGAAVRIEGLNHVKIGISPYQTSSVGVLKSRGRNGCNVGIGAAIGCRALDGITARTLDAGPR